MKTYKMLLPFVFAAITGCGPQERKPDWYSSTHVTYADKLPGPSRTFTDFTYNGKGLDGIDMENEVIIAGDVAEDGKKYYTFLGKRHVRLIPRSSPEFRQLENEFELAKRSK